MDENELNYLKHTLFTNKINEFGEKNGLKFKYNLMPKFLFIYKKLNNHTFDLLENDDIYLSSPSSFNDPFDSIFYASQEVIETGITYLIKTNQISIPPEINKEDLFKKESIIKELSKYTVTGQEYAESFKEIEKLNDHINTISREKLRIACFSEVNDSVLMWSHYAQNHEGICIKYNFKELGTENLLNEWFYPVYYTFERPEITDFLKSKIFGYELNKYIFDLFITTKAKEWEYEKEWRIISRIPHDSFPIPPAKSVYLGVNISDENKEKIKQIAKYKKFEVYQMKVSPSKYKLIPKKIKMEN